MTRILLPLRISVALAALAACGGKASSADTSDVPVVEPPATDVSSSEPPSLQTLELRRFDENALPDSEGPGCEYSERLKVYFRSRELITRFCLHEGGSYMGGRETKPLLDADLERIRSVYDQLQPTSNTQCAGSAGWMSLAVDSEDALDGQQLLDAEHSGCPLTRLEGEAFVEGLGQLYRLLAELRNQ